MAPAQHHPRAAVDGDGASLQDAKREERGVEHVSNVVRQLAQSFDFAE